MGIETEWSARREARGNRCGPGEGAEAEGVAAPAWVGFSDDRWGEAERVHDLFC